MSFDFIVPVFFIVLFVWYFLRVREKHKTGFKPSCDLRRISTPETIWPKEVENPVESNQAAVEISTEFLAFNLEQNISVEQQNALKADLETFSKPHPLLVSLTNDIVEPKKLFDIIRTDPQLGAKVINAANSPIFGLRKTINTLNHAVIYLGTTQVKNIAIQTVMSHSNEFETKAQQRAYNNIRSVSFIASSIGFLLGNEMKLDNVGQLSTQCLLNYLGDIALLHASPDVAEEYDKRQSSFERLYALQKITKTNPAAVGGLIAREWGLPAAVSSGIENSLDPLTDSIKYPLMGQEAIQRNLFCYLVCRLADTLVFEKPTNTVANISFNFAKTGNPAFYYTENQLERAGLSEISNAISSVSFQRKLAELVSNLEK